MICNYDLTSVFGGYPGGIRTIIKIKEYFYRPSLENVISSKVKETEICKKNNEINRRYEGGIISGQSKTPMNNLIVDTAGPLVRSTKGNCYNPNALEDMTKCIWLIPIRDPLSKTIIGKLENVIFNNLVVVKD